MRKLSSIALVMMFVVIMLGCSSTPSKVMPTEGIGWSMYVSHSWQDNVGTIIIQTHEELQDHINSYDDPFNMPPKNYLETLNSMDESLFDERYVVVARVPLNYIALTMTITGINERTGRVTITTSADWGPDVGVDAQAGLGLVVFDVCRDYIAPSNFHVNVVRAW